MRTIKMPKYRQLLCSLVLSAYLNRAKGAPLSKRHSSTTKSSQLLALCAPNAHSIAAARVAQWVQ